MKHRLFKAACLLAFICCLQISAQAQSKWDAKLKMPYSGDQLLLLRQFTHDAYAENSTDNRSYFEFYRLNLASLDTLPKLDCSHLIPALSDRVIKTLQEDSDTEENTEAEHVVPITVAETLCTDINQDNQPELLLKVSSSYYFGARYYGLFLYRQDGEQNINLFGMKPPHITAHAIAIHRQSNSSVWPDLLGISVAPTGFGEMIYLEPLNFSTASQKYESGSLKYSVEEKIYHTKDKKLSYQDFNSSRVNEQKFVMNRNGSLVGLHHIESYYPSTDYQNQVMVIETQSGRAEFVDLDNPAKGLMQGLKKRFPKYMQTQWFALLEPEILGFNQDNLIFKLHISGSCMDVAGPPCDGSVKVKATGPDDYMVQIEKLFPRRFAGYWSYHYRTGALKLISWDSKTPINVEHTGYDVEFR